MLPLIGYASLTAYGLVTMLKYLLSRWYIGKHPDGPVVPPAVDVTVLQPILSGDPLLQETLSRSIAVAPQGSRFWLLVDDCDEEGCRVAEALALNAPDIVRVIRMEPPSQGQNPKAAKLDKVLTDIESEFTAVLDDDTWLPHANLQRAAARLEECDLYTGLPCYLAAEGMWSSLVTYFVNNNTVMTYLAFLPLTGPLTINGMFYVARTKTLRELGGWGPSADLLCDDLAIANLFRDRGRRIHQGVTPQLLNTTVPSAKQYFSLMHRWYVFAEILVNNQPVWAKGLIVTLLGLPPLMLWCGLLAAAGGTTGVLCIGVILIGRHLVIHDLLRRVAPDALALSGWLSIVAELIQPFHWCHAKLSRTIKWRSRRIVAAADGRFTYVD